LAVKTTSESDLDCVSGVALNFALTPSQTVPHGSVEIMLKVDMSLYLWLWYVIGPKAIAQNIVSLYCRVSVADISACSLQYRIAGHWLPWSLACWSV